MSQDHTVGSLGEFEQDVNDGQPMVTAKVRIQNAGTGTYTLKGEFVTAEAFIQVCARALGVDVSINQVGLVHNGTTVTPEARLTGDTNVLAAAPNHDNG